MYAMYGKMKIPMKIDITTGDKIIPSDKRPLADFLPTLTIAAKNLATEMTNYNVEEKDLKGEGAITTGMCRIILRFVRCLVPEELNRKNFHHQKI